MPHLDIRSLSFIAMVSSLLLAVGLQFANRIITKDPSLRLWAIGATANGAGFVLLALRGVVPDLLSMVLGNTLLIVGMVWLYLCVLTLPLGSSWRLNGSSAAYMGIPPKMAER